MMNRDEKNGVLLKPQWMISPSAASSSSSHSNEHSNGTLSRSRSALNAATENDHWSSLSSALYRGTVSSNSSAVRDRGYISFSRSRRDRDRDRDRNRDRVRGRDRERDSSLDNGYCDYSDPVRHRAKRDLPRKSLPPVNGVQSQSLPRRPVSAVSNGIGSSGGGGGGDGIASFDSEFPSLGAEDRAKMSDVGQMSTPGVAAGIQSHVPALSDGCTSALVEAPSRVGSNGEQVPLVSQTVANTTSVASSTTTALSMAAAVAQAPARVHSAPQLTNDSERKKELMQLGMLVPKVAKRPIHNSLEKSKSKGARSSNYGAPKVSQFSNHQVLNRDKNGVDSTAKDGPTLRNSSRDAPPSVGGGVQVVQGHHLQSTVNSKLKVNGKVGGERRPLSQVQGRHDFFNSIRKKEMSRNSSAANLEIECVASSSSASNLLAQSCEHITVASASQEDIPAASTCNAELSLVENGNSGACDEEFEILAPPDEKEAAFLRSLGWEENAVEEPLTQMEIVSFLNKYSKHSVCTKLKAIFPELLHACSS